MERIVIGIDPGINHTGVAVLKGGVFQQGLLIERRFEDLAQNAKAQTQAMINTISSSWFTVCVIEMPRVYPKMTYAANDIVDLAFMAGSLVTAFYTCTEYVRTVYPSVWKGQTPKDIHNARILKRLPEMEHCLKSIPKSKREHIIDAAGLALWADGVKL